MLTGDACKKLQRWPRARFYFDICLLIFLTKDLVLVHTPGAFKIGKHPSLGLTEGTMANPDAQIYPHATGAAAEVVKLHQEPQDLVFWAGWVGALFDYRPFA